MSMAHEKVSFQFKPLEGTLHKTRPSRPWSLREACFVGGGASVALGLSHKLSNLLSLAFVFGRQVLV